MEITGDSHKERARSQLEFWVQGTSIHNEVDEECCPDFACCNPKIQTPESTRRRFAQAVAEDDEKARMGMLGGFLGAACATVGKKVHIIGDGSEGGAEH